jgi:hypothetical protein
MPYILAISKYVLVTSIVFVLAISVTMIALYSYILAKVAAFVYNHSCVFFYSYVDLWRKNFSVISSVIPSWH